MKMLTILLLIGIMTLAFCKAPEDMTYKEWKGIYKPEYSGVVDSFRQIIYNDNIKKIKENNKKNDRGVTLAPNQFSALTFQEFSASFLTYKQVITTNVQATIYSDFGTLSGGGILGATTDTRSIDWKARRKVTSIKNQGSCGSCVAFSTVASIESSFLIKNSIILNLAEQQFVDCVTANSGCGGGWYTPAFNYAVQKGLVLETQYPYTARNGYCLLPSGNYKVTSYVVSVRGDCQSLRNLVYSKGPASVAVSVDYYFQYYSSGILSYCTTTTLNHAVLLTGFNTTAWHIKNSWGTGWGQQGYIYLKAGASTCQICREGGHRVTAL